MLYELGISVNWFYQHFIYSYPWSSSSTHASNKLQLIKHHQLQHHAFADDTQIYGFRNSSDVDTLWERLSHCFKMGDSVWIMANRLQLSPTKPEVFCIASTWRQHQLPTTLTQLGRVTVPPVWDLNACVPSTTHFPETVRDCSSIFKTNS